MNLQNVAAWASRLGMTSIYLAMALPFGIATFTIAMVGLGMGIGMALFFWGIPILMLTAAIFRWYGRLERGLTSYLLAASFRDLPHPQAGLGWWDMLKWYVSDRYTWTSMLHALLKFPVGVAAFMLLSVAIATPIAFISAPIWAVGGEIELAGQQFDSLIAVPIGFLMIPISIALILGMGRFMRVMAELLLDGSQRSPRTSGPAQVCTFPESGSAQLVDA